MARLFKSHLQGDFGSDHKNFEAVVLEGRDLWHWWRDNFAPGNPWKRGQRIIENRAAFPGSLIQSDFGDGEHGNFEVVVPLFGDAGLVELWHMWHDNSEVVVPVVDNRGRVELQHYWHDNSDVNNPWSIGQRVSDPMHEIIGGGCIIQSDFGSDDHGNFEVAAW